MKLIDLPCRVEGYPIPEAQAMELHERFQHVNTPHSTPLKLGDLVVDKPGVGFIKAPFTVVLILWAFLDEQNPQDMTIIKDWQSRTQGVRVDCIVAYLSTAEGDTPAGASLNYMPHTRAHLMRYCGDTLTASTP